MPAKSRRGRKGRYAYQGKKQGAPSQPGAVQPAAAQAREPAPLSPGTSARRPAAAPARGAAQMAKPAAVRFAFVGKELRNIGILAGIMLALLLVLARVLA